MGYIGRKAATTILHGPRTAVAHGLPLNTHVVIRLWELGADQSTAAEHVRHLRYVWFGRWSGRASIRGGKPHLPANGTPTHSACIETKGGVHAHWHLHIREENLERFAKALDLRLRRQFRLPALPPGALFIGPSTNPEGLKLYMSKTMDPRYGRLWGIRTEDGGPLVGRRADSSRNLGPKTWKRLKAAYKASRST